MFSRAIVRRPGENCGSGLTTSTEGRPDGALLSRQHEQYVRTLRDLGLEVVVLPVEPEYPDAYFVEDTAVVVDEVAVICRPGNATRRGEEASIKPVLARYKDVDSIKEPGTVDGGDVLQVENRVFVGLSERTNRFGADQLGRILGRFGYHCSYIEVSEGLHLKSSVNFVGNNTLVLTDQLENESVFHPFNLITIPQDEIYAANSLLINESLLVPAGYPATREKLEGITADIIELDVSEIRKMDGGLTCMSLRF